MTAPNLSLYNIETGLLELLAFREEVMSDPDASPTEQQETAARIDQQIREYVTAEIRKVDGIAHHLREFERRAEIDRAEAKRIIDRARGWEQRHDRLEQVVKDVMLMTGNQKLEGEHNTLKLRANPASVDVRQPELLPRFLQRVTVTLTRFVWENVLRLAFDERVSGIVTPLLDAKVTEPEPMKSAIAEELKCTACRNVKAKREKCAECGMTGLSKTGVPGCVLVQNGVSLQVE